MGYIGNVPFTKASYNNIEVLATEGQTTFNVSYSPNFVDVLVNGVELSKTDYVALNGTSVVLNKPLALNDVVVFKVWGTFQTADAVATGDVNQTVEGVKTFTSSPIVPTPTTGTQAVNKKYVDDTSALTPAKLAAAFGGGNQGLTANGYQILPGGLIVQWGNVEIANRATEFDFGIHVFPISFSTLVLSAGATIVTTDIPGYADNFAVVKDISNTGMRVMSGSTVNQTRSFGVYWFAIGY